MTISSETMVGSIVFTSEEYYMFGDKDDSSKQAFLFALTHMSSVLLNCKDNKLVIDITENLLK